MIEVFHGKSWNWRSLTYASFVFFPPIGFEQVISLEHTLKDIVVLGIALLKQILLHHCKFTFIDSQQATLCLRVARFLPDVILLIELKQDFLPYGPTNVYAT